MLQILIYGMIYFGSALMVYNIYSYVRFSRELSGHGGWDKERVILFVPAVLLILFLIGYLMIAFFGKPDLLVSGILFGGSVFVFIVVYLLRRITNHIYENERLEAKLMAAEATNRAKEDFLSNMSHEMRTPLNAILGLLRLLEEDKGIPPASRTQLDKIDASARHLLTLINDVLDMGHIDSGTLTLKNARFSFGQLMMQLNSSISAQCQEKGLAYNCERIGSIDDEFIGDESKIWHVLQSIAENAVMYTDAPGRVQCSVEQIGADDNTRTLRFTVQDTGIGMTTEYLPHVFEPFSREDASPTNPRGGSGLGLPITKTIVELMNGSIDIQSEKGVGTTVTVTMTLGAVSAQPAEETAGQETGKVELAGRRILVAEDIDLNAEILMDLLDMEEMLSERAENGQIAVDMFRDSSVGYYDAVLMDLRMPVMDGLEATRQIRALDRSDAGTVPIIAVTANAFEKDVQSSLEAGMNAHLPKPADIDMLCDTLRRLIKQQ